jgi:hypothetical protein
VPTAYRLSARTQLRLVGAVLVLSGLLVLLLVAGVVLLPVPGAILTVAVVLAVVAVLATTLTVRSVDVVRLEKSGYRVRLLRGAGVRQAGWKDVEDVVATTVAGERCVQVRLRDGRSTIIPVDLLAGRTDDFVRDLQQHLNTGHGYRPLR